MRAAYCDRQAARAARALRIHADLEKAIISGDVGLTFEAVARNAKAQAPTPHVRHMAAASGVSLVVVAEGLRNHLVAPIRAKSLVARRKGAR